MNIQEQNDYLNANYGFYKNHTSRRNIRHDFFKNISTEIQAYLLGFFVADGSINAKRKNLRIHVSKKDSYIIDLYKNYISPKSRIFTINGKINNKIRNYNIKDNGSIGIDITSAILVPDLVNIGYGYNKTYLNWVLPNISKNLIPHFLRGLFDGDGSFSMYITKNNNLKFRTRLHITLHSKCETPIDSIINFLQSKNIKATKVYIKRDSLWRLSISSKLSILNFYNLLYSDAHFFLQRKYEIIHKYVNTEITIETKESIVL